MTLDFENLILELHNGNAPASQRSPDVVWNFDLNEHFPCVKANLGTRSLYLGIDTGAEVNLLRPGALKNQSGKFTFQENLRIGSFIGGRKRVAFGSISSMQVGGRELENLEVALISMEALGENLPRRLDGVLGTAFLRQFRVEFSFAEEKISLWYLPAKPGMAAGELSAEAPKVLINREK
jgi:hypothetical protein